MIVLNTFAILKVNEDYFIEGTTLTEEVKDSKVIISTKLVGCFKSYVDKGYVFTDSNSVNYVGFFSGEIASSYDCQVEASSISFDRI